MRQRRFVVPETTDTLSTILSSYRHPLSLSLSLSLALALAPALSLSLALPHLPFPLFPPSSTS